MSLNPDAAANAAFVALVFEPHGKPDEIAALTDAQKHASIDAMVVAFKKRWPDEYALRSSPSTWRQPPLAADVADPNERGDRTINELGGGDGGDSVMSLREFKAVRAWVNLSYSTSRCLYG